MSEVPCYDDSSVDPTVLQAIKSYSSANSYVYNSLKCDYGSDYHKLPHSETTPSALQALQYEPEIERSEEVYNPSDKRGMLFQLTTVTGREKYSLKDVNKHVKRRWVVLRKMEEEDTTTGYILECYKEEREEQRGKEPRVTYFLADPVFEARVRNAWLALLKLANHNTNSIITLHISIF